MSWKEAVRTCVDLSIKGGVVEVVVSPDVDGVVSFFLLQEYLKKRNVNAVLVGEYNSKQLLAYQAKPKNIPYLVHTPLVEIQNLLDNALFLDLDVRFAQHVIGQHYLGNVTLPEKTYFNPNIFFDIQEYTSKYPYGTAQLLMWALFDEKDFPTFKHKFSLAQAFFVHADSTYMNCKAYNRNATNWASRLFGSVDKSPASLQRLLSKDYFANGLKVHQHMLATIRPYVKGNGKVENNTWDACSGHQSCLCTGDVFALLNLCSVHFHRGTVDVEPPKETMVVWEGELRTVKRHVIQNMETFLREKHVQSHAVINLRTVSCTFGTVPTDSSIVESQCVQDGCL